MMAKSLYHFIVLFLCVILHKINDLVSHPKFLFLATVCDIPLTLLTVAITCTLQVFYNNFNILITEIGTFEFL